MQIINYREVYKKVRNGKMYTYPVKEIILSYNDSLNVEIELVMHGPNCFEIVTHHIEDYINHYIENDLKFEFNPIFWDPENFSITLEGSVDSLSQYLFNVGCISNHIKNEIISNIKNMH